MLSGIVDSILKIYPNIVLAENSAEFLEYSSHALLHKGLELGLIVSLGSLKVALK